MDVLDHNLAGKLLISMPDMGDPRFDRSVIYVCSHDADGAMGLIVNKPRRKLRFFKLLKQLEIEVTGIVRETRVYYGGPVETLRGFVLHTSDYHCDAGTEHVHGDISLTATIDVLQDIAMGKGPKTSLMGLGYAGWGPDQLEDEIAANSWLICDATDALVFGKQDDAKWTQALAQLGVSPNFLSTTAGHA